MSFMTKKALKKTKSSWVIEGCSTVISFGNAFHPNIKRFKSKGSDSENLAQDAKSITFDMQKATKQIMRKKSQEQY